MTPHPVPHPVPHPTPPRISRPTANDDAAPRGGAGLVVGASPLRPLLSHLPRIGRVARRRAPGSAPGMTVEQLRAMSVDTEPGEVTCIDFSPERVEVTPVEDPFAFLAEHRPPWVRVRWVNVVGLSDTRLIQAMQAKYHLHPLAVEDVIHVPQRPKAEVYQAQAAPGEGAEGSDGGGGGGGGGGRFERQLFIVSRMLQLKSVDQAGDVGGGGKERVDAEQVSIFLGRQTVLTIQERPGDVFNPIRERVRTRGSKLRTHAADFLVYALLDAMVDHGYPILEHLATQLNELDAIVYDTKDVDFPRRVHGIKLAVMELQRELWPMQTLVGDLLRLEGEVFEPETRTHLRDVSDHVAQLLDLLRSYRDVATSIAETYTAEQGQRMNEVMKVLTMVAAIFIPISFLAGVFGMNFDDMPYLHDPAAFKFFCIACVSLAGGMAWWFKRKGWW